MEREPNQSTLSFFKALISGHGSNLAEIARLLGKKEAAFYRQLKNDTLRYNEAERIAQILEYNISWVSAEGFSLNTHTPVSSKRKQELLQVLKDVVKEYHGK
jgi:hypothetical protein